MRKLFLIILCFTLTGCGRIKLPDSLPHNENQTVHTETEAHIVAPEATNEYPDEQIEESIQTSLTVNPIQATIYYGNENADGFIAKTVLVEELNTDTLISELIKVGVLSEGVSVVSEKHVGTCLYLDFNNEFRDRICSMGTSGEYIIVGSLVNTFVDNFKDTTHSVYITVNGDILESGHVIYDFELTFFNVSVKTSSDLR